MRRGFKRSKGMSGKSSKTTVVGIRLPNNIVEILKQRSGEQTISDYLRKKIIQDMEITCYQEKKYGN
jgi:hypothetical protein